MHLNFLSYTLSVKTEGCEITIEQKSNRAKTNKSYILY